MLGIENLRKLLSLGLKIGKQTAEITEDKKVTWMELLQYTDELLLLPGVVTSWQDIVDELNDLDDEELTQLHGYFAAEFDIPNDKIEAFVEDAALQATSLISLIKRFKDLKTPTE